MRRCYPDAVSQQRRPRVLDDLMLQLC
uniref:Uncharacterized protein n=1 Tax=Arundo donax TaxID=35708 RepID=A0A0A8YKJ1_ARUDO